MIAYCCLCFFWPDQSSFFLCPKPMAFLTIGHYLWESNNESDHWDINFNLSISFLWWYNAYKMQSFFSHCFATNFRITMKLLRQLVLKHLTRSCWNAQGSARLSTLLTELRMGSQINLPLAAVSLSWNMLNEYSCIYT